MANETLERIIHHHVYDPARSLFKSAKNDRAEVQTIHCRLESCPLLARGCCMFQGVIGTTRCPYGRRITETGPTKRAAKYSSWINEKLQEGKGVSHLTIPPTKMAFVGDWVYLPYAHMTMCEAVPFRSHSAIIISGDALIPLEAWTLKTVETLIGFRPRSMMGGVIASYQRDVVPLFLQHIREESPDMWAQLIAKRPDLDTAPNFVGRKALLRTLNAPIEIPAYDNRYPVRWTWDGETLTTCDRNAYSDTWGHIKLESFELNGKPKEDAVIEVKSNHWVNENTVFVD